MYKKFAVPIAFFAMMFVGSDLIGQEISELKLQEIDAQAIKCWLRSDKTAVRIGETFMLTLTCQVIETEYEKVVPKEESLDSSVVALSPYEVVEGWHHQDIRRGNYRFFQYQYKMKLAGEEFFGKEIPIPELEILYTIERKINADQNLDTRERKYLLPALKIRILSLVPQNTKDIRDSSDDNFRSVKVTEQRAYVAFVFAGLLLLLPFSVFLKPLVKYVSNWKKSTSNGTGFSNAELLRRMKGELSAIHRTVKSKGWNSELVGKMLTTVRIMGSIAISEQINQLPTRFESTGLEGQLKLRKGLIWPKKVLISSNLTLETVIAKRDRLNSGWAEDFISVFTLLNNVRYGRKFDGTELGNVYIETADLLGKIRFSNHWLVRKWVSLCGVANEWRPVWRHS